LEMALNVLNSWLVASTPTGDSKSSKSSAITSSSFSILKFSAAGGP